MTLIKIAKIYQCLQIQIAPHNIIPAYKRMVYFKNDDKKQMNKLNIFYSASSMGKKYSKLKRIRKTFMNN